MLSNEDKIFLSTQKNSEHFRVFKRVLALSKEQTTMAIAGAKSSEHLLIAQGIIRSLIALENTLNTASYEGAKMVDEAEQLVKKEALRNKFKKNA